MVLLDPGSSFVQDIANMRINVRVTRVLYEKETNYNCSVKSPHDVRHKRK